MVTKFPKLTAPEGTRKVWTLRRDSRPKISAAVARPDHGTSYVFGKTPDTRPRSLLLPPTLCSSHVLLLSPAAKSSGSLLISASPSINRSWGAEEEPRKGVVGLQSSSGRRKIGKRPSSRSEVKPRLESRR